MFIKINELSELVKLSIPSIYRLQREGRFPRSVKIGHRAVAWRKSEVEEWAASRQSA